MGTAIDDARHHRGNAAEGGHPLLLDDLAGELGVELARRHEHQLVPCEHERHQVCEVGGGMEERDDAQVDVLSTGASGVLTGHDGGGDGEHCDVEEVGDDVAVGVGGALWLAGGPGGVEEPGGLVLVHG